MRGSLLFTTLQPAATRAHPPGLFSRGPIWVLLHLSNSDAAAIEEDAAAPHPSLKKRTLAGIPPGVFLFKIA
jgi:hypothetical protein